MFLFCKLGPKLPEAPFCSILIRWIKDLLYVQVSSSNILRYYHAIRGNTLSLTKSKMGEGFLMDSFVFYNIHSTFFIL